MGSIKPSLGDIHALLSTSDCAKLTVYKNLVITTIHISLLKENNIFFSESNILDASCQQLQFDSLWFYSLNDIHCAVLPIKERCTKIELVFSKRNKVGPESGIVFSKYCEKEINTQLTVIPSILQSSLHIPSEIWKLTFSSSEEAIWLIMHLPRYWNTNKLRYIPNKSLINIDKIPPLFFFLINREKGPLSSKVISQTM